MSYFELATTGWKDTEKYADIVIDLADWMIDVHCTLQRTRNTAYAYEGIIHAYEIAKQRGDLNHAEKFACVIDKGLRRLTSWQVGGPIQNSYLRKHFISDRPGWFINALEKARQKKGKEGWHDVETVIHIWQFLRDTELEY